MPLSDWTRMAIASAVAVIAISFLAIDAGIDVNTGAIAKRVATARASIMDAVVRQHEVAFEMAHGVVHFLELVQVHQHHRKWAPRT